ncbi:MAG: hypothetical protein ACON35_01515 [Candidatus Marinamargulisbacteria bacterium]
MKVSHQSSFRSSFSQLSSYRLKKKPRKPKGDYDVLRQLSPTDLNQLLHGVFTKKSSRNIKKCCYRLRQAKRGWQVDITRTRKSHSLANLTSTNGSSVNVKKVSVSSNDDPPYIQEDYDVTHLQGYDQQLSEAGYFIFHRFKQYFPKAPSSTSQMIPTKFVKSSLCKTVPVEYKIQMVTRTENFAFEINFDDPNYAPKAAKDGLNEPHIGYKIFKNGKKLHVGHVIVSRLDAGRLEIK